MTCPVACCVRPTLIVSTGLCDAHYRRQRRWGTPTGGGVSRGVDPAERFRQQVGSVRADGCQLWQGSTVTNRRGITYGRMKVEERNVLVHRWVYVQAHGPLTPGQVVRHTCDVSLCVHPDHLLVGSQQDNVNDCIQRGRAWWQQVVQA